MDIELLLSDIGLTKNEIKVYLGLLELGSTATGNLIKKTSIHTSKVYDSLERLIEKGLVSYVIVANTKHFKAVAPERLLDFLEEKKRRISEQEANVRSILPELKLKQDLSQDETDAEIFKGWKGMETVYRRLRDTLKAGDLNYVFGASKGEDPVQVQRFFNKHVQLLAKKKIRQRIIFNEEARGWITEMPKYQELFEVRHMPHTTPAEINIWADNVMVIVLTKKPTVVLITNKKVAGSFRDYFNAMWTLATP